MKISNFSRVKLSRRCQHILPKHEKPVCGGKTQPSVMGNITHSCRATHTWRSPPPSAPPWQISYCLKQLHPSVRWGLKKKTSSCSTSKHCNFLYDPFGVHNHSISFPLPIPALRWPWGTKPNCSLGEYYSRLLKWRKINDGTFLYFITLFLFACIPANARFTAWSAARLEVQFGSLCQWKKMPIIVLPGTIQRCWVAGLHPGLPWLLEWGKESKSNKTDDSNTFTSSSGWQWCWC